MPPCVLTLAALFSLFTSQLSATLMSADDPQFGAGSLTVDSSTNLAWLDLSITEGNSFNEVSSQLDSGGTYSGFRFASPEEVFRLFEEAHIPDINDPGISGQQGTLANAPPTLALIQLMGPSYERTLSGVHLSEIAGFSSKQVTMHGYDLIQMPFAVVREDVVTPQGTLSFGEAFTTGTWIFPANSYVGVGSWLVRSIPEPPSVALLSAGIVLLTLTFRINRKTS